MKNNLVPTASIGEVALAQSVGTKNNKMTVKSVTTNTESVVVSDSEKPHSAPSLPRSKNKKNTKYNRKSNVSFVKSSYKPELFSIDYAEANSSQVDRDIEIHNRVQPYFKSLSYYTGLAKESIYVLDYFEHGKQLEQDDPFYSAIQTNNADYFEKLEDLVKGNSDIDYVRVLQLPIILGMQYTPDLEEKMFSYALDTLYTPTLNHISNLINLSNFKLYILPKAVRIYSQIVVDSKIWVIELDKYDAELRAKPDRLMVRRAEEGTDVARIISEEYNTMRMLIGKSTAVAQHQVELAVERRISKQNLQVGEDEYSEKIKYS